MRQSADIGLIIPLKEEFESAREILRFGEPDRDFYYPFTIPGRSLRGIATVLFEMGQATSAEAATRLLAQFDLRLLAVIGIAGALDADLRLGDVVIADAVDEYLHAAKVVPDGTDQGFEFELGGLPWRPGHDIVSYANNFGLLASGSELTKWRERARSRQDPSIQGAIPALAKATPDYRVGPIATGDIVSAAAPFAHWLRRRNRRLVAIEMEAGGVARALYREGRTDLIVIRGISDFADERKRSLDSSVTPATGSGAWRRYAVLNAVDLFTTLVANSHFPWPDLINVGRGQDGAAGTAEGGIAMHAQASGHASINQAGRDLHVGDTYVHTTPEVDHATLGAKALAAHDYASAHRHFAAAAEASPGDPLIQYQLSLAQLDGRRPHMHSAATIEQVERRLKSVLGQLPEAKALYLLVAEDYRLTWKGNNVVPDELIDLINSIPIQRAREITEHVPAKEGRVWRLLSARTGNRY